MTGVVTVPCSHGYGPLGHFPGDCRLALMPFPELESRVVLMAECPLRSDVLDRLVVKHGPYLSLLLASGVVVDAAVREYLEVTR